MAGPDLPPLPQLEADPGEHLDFVNQALRRKWNHIARVRKYGNVAPILVLIFENRDELHLMPQHHRHGGGLRDAMHAYDGIICPSYSKPQMETVFAALIKAADLHEANNEQSILEDDLDMFLMHCLTGDNEILRRPEGDDEAGEMFRAVSDFHQINRRRTGRLDETPPALLFWHGTQRDRWGNRHEGLELWIPRGALATYLRVTRSPFAGRTLKYMLFSLGWREQDFHIRSPSEWTRRVKANVWLVELPWEPAQLDLVALAGNPANSDNHVPTSPDVPLRSNAREGQPRVRARRAGDVGGRSHNGRKRGESE